MSVYMACLLEPAKFERAITVAIPHPASLKPSASASVICVGSGRVRGMMALWLVWLRRRFVQGPALHDLQAALGCVATVAQQLCAREGDLQAVEPDVGCAGCTATASVCHRWSLEYLCRLAVPLPTTHLTPAATHPTPACLLGAHATG